MTNFTQEELEAMGFKKSPNLIPASAFGFISDEGLKAMGLQRIRGTAKEEGKETKKTFPEVMRIEITRSEGDHTAAFVLYGELKEAVKKFDRVDKSGSISAGYNPNTGAVSLTTSGMSRDDMQKALLTLVEVL